MTRAEHNAYWQANRQPNEEVSCNLVGYGELTQYDADCPSCWLGHRHTWSEHDAYLVGGAARFVATVEHGGNIARVRWQGGSYIITGERDGQPLPMRAIFACPVKAMDAARAIAEGRDRPEHWGYERRAS